VRIVLQASPLRLLRKLLPHKGGGFRAAPFSLHHQLKGKVRKAGLPTSPLVGEVPRSCAAEGGSLSRAFMKASEVEATHAPAL
jgi:hypothetical protein